MFLGSCRRLLVPLLAAVSVTALTAGVAPAQINSASIVFIVDESGSMGGEQAFLQTFVPSVDTELMSAGVTGTSYGLVGYGNGLGIADLGRSFNVGAGLLGTAAEFATAAAGLVTSGGFEDGYSAIDFTNTTYTFPTGDKIVYVLVTDEDRDNGNAALTFATTEAALAAQNITLAGILDITVDDIDDNNAIASDGTNAFFLEGGVIVARPLGSIGGAGTTVADYVDLSFATPNGCVADLNQLRSGGAAADAFAEIFAACLVSAVIGGPIGGGNLIHFLNVYRDSADILVESHVGNIRRMLALNPGDSMVVNALNGTTQNVSVRENVGGLPGSRAWVIGDFKYGDYDRRDGTNSAFDYTGGGIAVGVDMALPRGTIPGYDFRFGGAVGYQFLSADINGPAFGNLSADAGTLSLFAAAEEPGEGLQFSAIATFGAIGYDQNRVTPGAVFPGNTLGVTLGLDLEGGYRLTPMPVAADTSVQVGGFLGLGVHHRSIDGFTEDNGGVTVAGFGDTSLVGRIGGRAVLVHAMPEGDAFLSGEVSVAFDALEDDESVLINAGALTTQRIAALEDVTGRLAISAGMDIDETMRGAISYSGEFGAHSMAHGVSATLEVRF